MRRLEEFIRENPALANVPYFSTRIGLLSPIEALNALRAGKISEEELGIDPDIWELTEEYYKRLAQLPGPKPKIYILGYELTIEEACKHIRERTEIGKALVEAHSKLLKLIEEKLK